MAGRASKSILIVEDDVELCSLMVDFFAPYGIEVEVRHDGRQGLERALAGSFDLLILDVMLPVLDGTLPLVVVAQRERAIRGLHPHVAPGAASRPHLPARAVPLGIPPLLEGILADRRFAGGFDRLFALPAWDEWAARLHHALRHG